jgi:serine/threonine protein kinase
MEYSVEGLCNQLARSRLLDANTVRGLRQRWRGEAGATADDGERFGKWLVAGRQVTDFQLGLLTRGFGDMLFFGEYKLVDRIGQGRMAGVYKAVHPTGPVVAVKVLPPSKANHPQLLGRFQREARLALRLKHPNVVRTFQRGQTKGGLHYIVMEYLDGETLEDILKRRKRLPVNDAAHVLAQAFQGLQHLHEEGLIHRDLKPANLMVVPGRVPGQPDTTLHSTVKILDIGLGRALFDFDDAEGGPSDNPDLTAEGSLLGTPNYMAPEQARSAHLADIRSDIYSLGCVLYEALTGQSPFPDTSFVRQMLRHATEPHRPLKELNPAVPGEVQAVMDTLLAKDPAQRYATPAQAARALQGFVTTDADAPKPLEAEPQMRTFLTWLEMRPAEPEEGQAPPPAAPPVAPATPTVPPPAPRAAALTPLAPGPAAALALPPAMAAPAAPPVALPVALPVGPVADSRPKAALPAPPVAVRRKSLGAWLRERCVTTRDLLVAAAGAGVLLVLEGLVWLIVRLFR